MEITHSPLRDPRAGCVSFMKAWHDNRYSTMLVAVVLTG
jgi:hypothetical protein